MPNKDTKFYYYDISAFNNKGEKENLQQIIKQNTFTPQRISTTTNEYTVAIENHVEDLFMGRILRTKPPEAYYKLEDNDTNPENLEENFRLGEKERDTVEFALAINKNKIKILLETGFQTPGMGIIMEYLNLILKEKNLILTFKVSTIEKVSRISQIMGKPVKSFTITLKKNPVVPENCKQLEDTLSKYASSDTYAITVQVKVSRMKKGSQLETLEDILSKMFGNKIGKDFEGAIESGTDFPSFLTNLNFDLINDDNTIIHENILAKFESETININKNKLTDHQAIGKMLCELLSKKINRPR